MNAEAASRARAAPVLTVLIVLGNETSTLVNILRHSNWEVQIATGFEDAAARLHTSAPNVVVAPYRSNGTAGWVYLLELLNRRCPAPRLVLTDRHTDDFMWAEALNLGAWDVLAQPLDSGEVFRVLTSAWQAWRCDSLRG